MFLKKSNQQFKNIKNNPRNTFLLAQLYQDLNVKDTASELYSEIIDTLMTNATIPARKVAGIKSISEPSSMGI